MLRRLQWVTVGLLFAGGLINYMDRAVFGVLAPLISKELQLDPAQLGLALSVFSFGYTGSALVKELRLQFVLGYVPEDFARALDLLRSLGGRATAMVSRIVGFGELPEAFEALRHPNPNNKVLLDPSRA
jgi:MFS family permease